MGPERGMTEFGWFCRRAQGGRTAAGWGLGTLLILAVLVLAVGCERETSPEKPAASRPVLRTGAEIFEPCLLCHSTKEMQRGPILDGLPAYYVISQLQKFQAGIRGHNPTNRSEALMAAGSSTLLNSMEIPVVARYIAGLPPQAHLATVRGNLEVGRHYFQICVPCHGPDGRGNPALKASPLAFLEDWYLVDQLRKFKSGMRGTHPQDLEGQIMKAAIVALPDAHIRDVAAYIAQELAVGR